MKKAPKTRLMWVIESLKGRKHDGVFYESLGQAEQFAPLNSIIWKRWITEIYYGRN